MTNIPDNRKSPRHGKAVFTAVKWYRSGKPVIADVGQTINISETGALLEITEAVPFLSSIEMSLSLGLVNEIIKVGAEVIHLRKTSDDKIEMGVKFLELADVNVTKIRDAISDH